jgi:biopolymer transport protein TolR
MRRPSRARPDINITPLVDVVLVLLIIFMVIIPQMQAGANVNPPGIKHPDQKNDVKYPPITLSVTESGNLYVEKRAVDRAGLVDVLRTGHARQPNSKLVLKGDRKAPYGLMRELFKDAHGIGFPGISLQVGDLRKGEGG